MQATDTTKRERITQRHARLATVFGDLLSDEYGTRADAADYLAVMIALEAEQFPARTSSREDW